ncbi:HTH_48 domain-containing protein [Trichonephila clavipes]|nr:HTH_48 domain-containing protein [Trichonephila clavipes]
MFLRKRTCHGVRSQQCSSPHSFIGQQSLTNNNVELVPPPSYSPDLAPSTFFLLLFPRMKRSLTGKRFSDADEVKENPLMALNSILLQESQNCFVQFQKPWDK